jgi:hypothetical protein
MNEEKVKNILGGAIMEDNSISTFRGNIDFAIWGPHDYKILLDGEFTSEQLMALAWWMDNHYKGGEN